MLFKKSNGITVSAATYEDEKNAGISLARYGEETFACLETDGTNVRLVLNENEIKAQGILIVHADENWNDKWIEGREA